jgi:hypothetical protein
MVARPLKLAIAMLLTAAAGAGASAQTASNPVAVLTLPNQAEVPVSPVTPATTPGSVLTGESAGLNPLTGLPCSGAGSLSVSGVGGLADTATPPPGADDSATPQLPTITSVFGTATTLGSC